MRRKFAKIPCAALAGAVLWCAHGVAADVSLPTPLDHYDSYDLEASGRALALQILAELSPELRTQAMAIVGAAQSGNKPEYTVEEVQEILETIDWERWRPQILGLFLHASRVLEAVPASLREEWQPLVHDSLLFFLDHLSEERFVERLVEQVNLPRDALRGERILAFIAKTPSLQKLAQILSRNPLLDQDIRVALQTVENGLSTMNYREVRAQLDKELGPEVLERYHIRFADGVLAEASVGAVVEATLRPLGSDEVERAACKVLKPYAVEALKEDLVIIDGVLAFLEANAEFYRIGDSPLVDIFRDIRDALSREVRVEDEQFNLLRAEEYYRTSERIRIPKVYGFSTPNVTCMEFIEGEKITDAFPGRQRDRAELAKRLSDALTFDVLFSEQELAIFHGDPHAGNVFHVHDDPREPYRIALLDWGLSAQFSREERAKLVQMMVGLYLKDAKRLANNVDVLVQWEPQTKEQRESMRSHLSELVRGLEGDEIFPLLDDLIVALAREGYAVRFESAIFIKSQLTIGGILTELDPDFEQDKYLMGRMTRQVFKEVPKRLLHTVWFPAWNSHAYRSMLSNEDVRDVQFARIGRGFKKVGKAIWSFLTP